jgi:hypothetical protein
MPTGDRQLGIFRNSEYRKYSVNGILSVSCLLLAYSLEPDDPPKSPALRLPTFGDVGSELTNSGGRPPGEMAFWPLSMLWLGARLWSRCDVELFGARALIRAAFVRRGRNGDVKLFRARALIRTAFAPAEQE